MIGPLQHLEHELLVDCGEIGGKELQKFLQKE